MMPRVSSPVPKALKHFSGLTTSALLYRACGSATRPIIVGMVANQRS
jgi:hypothetical protein